MHESISTKNRRGMNISLSKKMSNVITQKFVARKFSFIFHAFLIY